MICGCSKVVEPVTLNYDRFTNNAEAYNKGRASVAVPDSKDDWNQTNPATWMRVMEIWHCESDGKYELKTSYSMFGSYDTVEAARVAKTNKANEMVEFVKAGGLNFTIKTIPDCGKRIE